MVSLSTDARTTRTNSTTSTRPLLDSGSSFPLLAFSRLQLTDLPSIFRLRFTDTSNESSVSDKSTQPFSTASRSPTTAPKRMRSCSLVRMQRRRRVRLSPCSSARLEPLADHLHPLLFCSQSVSDPNRELHYRSSRTDPNSLQR
jgi:hypothetical protein